MQYYNVYVSRTPDFKAKMHQIQFPLGKLTALPRPLAVFKGPISTEGVEKGSGRNVEGKGRESGGKGEEGDGWREEEGEAREKFDAYRVTR